MDKNKALIGLGIVAAVVTIGTTVYYVTKRPEDEAPGVEEEIPYEPPASPGLADPEAAFGGPTTGTTTDGDIVVPTQFQW